MERSTVQSCLAAPFLTALSVSRLSRYRHSTHSLRSRYARGILIPERVVPQLSLALRRLFIPASRIPAHAFASQSWTGLELVVIVPRCERSNRSARRRDEGTGPQERGASTPTNASPISRQCDSCSCPFGDRGPLGRQKFKGLEMTKSRGIGRGGARPGSGRKRKAITPRVQALKDALAALRCGASKFNDADRRFVRAMIALGAPNNATASAFGISEVELLAKFPDELESRAADLQPARHSN
jgi:hypothetical protein